MEGAGQGYAPPVVRDYGDLVSLTEANAVMAHVGLGGMGAAGSSTPTTAPGGGGGGGGTTPTGASPAVPGGATLPATEGGGDSAPGGLAGNPLGASAGGGSGGGGAGGSGGHGGGLPFTGFAVAVIGALGSGMAATGVALRHRLRRARSPR
jgi:hypothetical protein